MSVPIFTVDAFADRPFTGNPAAVCLLEGPRPDAWLQSMAMEMNLSETAFTWPEGNGRRLRWLTPTVEVDLCGHATLATAHVLWETGRATGPIHFESRSGPLTAEQRDGRIELNFPGLPPRMTDADPELTATLGVEATQFGNNGMDAFVVVANESTVRSCRPDFRRLAAFNVRGVILTAVADAGQPYDFVSRFFAPPPASMKTRSPGRPIAACSRSGKWSWADRRSSVFKRQSEADSSMFAATENASSWAGRR